MTDNFYRAFEDRHRGSRELIQSRLRIYLPFVEPLKEIYPDCRAVDLGCGRGEWLELMREVGIDARGVDLDEGMLTACQECGLSVEQRDAIEFLQSLPAESVAVVSAFHVVEHIPFPVLQELVQAALRVLAPAGLLILETPNPENLSVGACKFYYDPTHQRPIPPPLLSFLPEHYGFARTKILRLQESPWLKSAGAITIENVLTSVSPDYAVVAQKGEESPGHIALFDKAFSREYGVDLETLAGRFQARIERFAQTQEQLSRTQAHLDAMYASTSWRVTAPLRAISLGVRAARQVSGNALLRLKSWLKPHVFKLVANSATRSAMQGAGRWVLANPIISNPIKALAQRHPRLLQRLRWLILAQGTAPVAVLPRPPLLGKGQNVALRVRQPLMGSASDIDELMLRIEDELLVWRDRPLQQRARAQVANLDKLMSELRSSVEARAKA